MVGSSEIDFKTFSSCGLSTLFSGSKSWKSAETYRYFKSSFESSGMLFSPPQTNKVPSVTSNSWSML